MMDVAGRVKCHYLTTQLSYHVDVACVRRCYSSWERLAKDAENICILIFHHPGMLCSESPHLDRTLDVCCTLATLIKVLCSWKSCCFSWVITAKTPSVWLLKCSSDTSRLFSGVCLGARWCSLSGLVFGPLRVQSPSLLQVFQKFPVEANGPQTLNQSSGANCRLCSQAPLFPVSLAAGGE